MSLENNNVSLLKIIKSLKTSLFGKEKDAENLQQELNQKVAKIASLQEFIESLKTALFGKEKETEYLQQALSDKVASEKELKGNQIIEAIHWMILQFSL